MVEVLKRIIKMQLFTTRAKYFCFIKALNFPILIILIAFTIIECSKPTKSSDEYEIPATTEPFPPILADSVGLDLLRLNNAWQVVENWYESNEIVGGELLIIKDRRTVLHRSIGWKDREDGEAFELETICRIRSMTKPLVGTAILMLSDDGMLDLNDNVSDYIDAFNTQNKENITVKQLLQHTAGLGHPGYPGNPDGFESLAEIVTAIAQTPLMNMPGDVFNYSDAGAITLSYLVSIVSGISVDEYIRLNIFRAIGMGSSFCMYDVNDPRSRRVSSSYRYSGSIAEGYYKYWDSETPIGINYFRGSGGAFSTTKNYAMFLVEWLDAANGVNTDFLRIETARSALQASDHSIAAMSPYGFMWFLGPAGNAGSVPIFGHTGYGGTAAWIIPEENIVIAYFTQCDGTDTRFRILNDVVLQLGL
jgi:CubicO group peptidase (beta-lactamase class C family)